MSKHYMEKDGVIKAIPANEWTRYRADGYTFSSLKKFQAQQAGKAPDRDEGDAQGPTMDNTKSEIMDYADTKGIDYDSHDTKAEILAAIAG